MKKNYALFDCGLQMKNAYKQIYKKPQKNLYLFMLSMFLILTTYPNKPRDCKKFIIGMIKGGFAACVQKINYAKSYYMRNDKLTQAEEKILLIKCSSTQKEKLLAYIKKQHPYEIPEILVLKPEQVDEAYEKWIENGQNKPQ